MAYGNSITVTETSSGNLYSIISSKIYCMAATGTGSTIQFSVDGAAPRSIVVDEDPATILGLTDRLLPVTVNSVTQYINVNYIEDMSDEGTGTKIVYTITGAAPYFIHAEESRIDIQNLLINLTSAVS